MFMIVFVCVLSMREIMVGQPTASENDINSTNNIKNNNNNKIRSKIKTKWIELDLYSELLLYFESLRLRMLQ